MSKSTMTKGTMGKPFLPGTAGHFGLRKNIYVPPVVKASEPVESEIVPENIENIAESTESIETESAESVENAESAESAEVESTESSDEPIVSTMNVPEEKEEELKEGENPSNIEESFECPICGKVFSSNIALQGHLRGACGKK